MGHAIFVFGPAGSGKTTLCINLQSHGETLQRRFHLVNLDPAQINETTEYSIDLRDHITVSDVMENYDFGPNGGLMIALEELLENMDELDLESYEKDYLIIDCPGQIELFNHSDVMYEIVEYFKRYFSCCIVYLIESQYLTDVNKYINGCLTALLSMCKFSLPHINIIAKMDLMADNIDVLDLFLNPDERVRCLITGKRDKFSELNLKMFDFVNENDMLSFLPLNWEDEDTVYNIMYAIDNAIQYYESIEPKETIK
jgi:GTPase SAR1 family protein